MPRRRAVSLALVFLTLAAAAAAPLAAEQPAKVFAKSCAPCHGKDGKPSAVFAQQGVRDFTAPAWQKATSGAQIEKTIREGKKGTMMASFAGQLSAEETKGLVGYIRKLGAKK
jgi:mono/diheme cytochrome c family protein